MTGRLCLVLSILVLTSACASYKSSSVPIPAASAMQASEVQEDLMVQATALGSVKEQEAYFDANFREAGVVALQVRVENQTDSKYLVRSGDMILEVSENQRYHPVSPNTVVHTVGEDGSVVGAALAFGIIGLIAATNAEEQARSARTIDYENKAFKDVTLEPGESRAGFAFFIPPQGVAAFNEATLKVRFVNYDNADSHTISLSLNGIGYGGSMKESQGGQIAQSSGIAPCQRGCRERRNNRSAHKAVPSDQEQASGQTQLSYFDGDDGEPLYSRAEAQTYFDTNPDPVLRDIYAYNKANRVALYNNGVGSINGYTLHSVKVLELKGDQVIAKATFSMNKTWNVVVKNPVFLFQWVGDELKIVGHI